MWPTFRPLCQDRLRGTHEVETRRALHHDALIEDETVTADEGDALGRQFDHLNRVVDVGQPESHQHDEGRKAETEPKAHAGIGRIDQELHEEKSSTDHQNPSRNGSRRLAALATLGKRDATRLRLIGAFDVGTHVSGQLAKPKALAPGRSVGHGRVFPDELCSDPEIPKEGPHEEDENRNTNPLASVFQSHGAG